MARAYGMFFPLYWAARGTEVDAFYRLQGLLFGNEPDLATIATKVFMDQFVYCIFWAAPLPPSSTDGRTVAFPGGGYARRRAVNPFLRGCPSPCSPPGWSGFPLPPSSIPRIPPALQVPLFSLTLCFFVLLVSVFSADEGKA